MYLIKISCCVLSACKESSPPDVDEEIDYLSSVIAKQQISEVKPSGTNCSLKNRCGYGWRAHTSHTVHNLKRTFLRTSLAVLCKPSFSFALNAVSVTAVTHILRLCGQSVGALYGDKEKEHHEQLYAKVTERVENQTLMIIINNDCLTKKKQEPWGNHLK